MISIRPVHFSAKQSLVKLTQVLSKTLNIKQSNIHLQRFKSSIVRNCANLSDIVS